MMENRRFMQTLKFENPAEESVNYLKQNAPVVEVCLN